MRDHFHFLRNVYFFNELSDDEIRELVQLCHEEKYDVGDIIFTEASFADKFYIVIEGTVEVWKNYRDLHRECLAVGGVGHLFGEMALVDELPRSATVVAKETVRLLCINRDNFHRIITENSIIALSIMKSISAMVRKSNETFVEVLRERNTKLEKAYHDLKEAQEDLLTAERMSALGKFSSLILHDIKNPLSILRGYAEMMLFNPMDPDRVKKNSEKIINEADRLNRLANELLDYSRGEIRLNVSIVDVRELVSSVVESISDKFQSRGIKIVVQNSFTGHVLLDSERIYRVFLNLADNARKALPKGGEFCIRVDREADVLSIAISDNGVGMIKEVREKIFEPFYSYSVGGGTGLGMSIVKSVVEAHDGSLSVQSEKNRGTTFTIRLPILG